MSKADTDRAPFHTPATECALRRSAATAVRGEDGSWVAIWGAPDGRGGETLKRKSGFRTEVDALAHARKLELLERLNRC